MAFSHTNGFWYIAVIPSAITSFKLLNNFKVFSIASATLVFYKVKLISPIQNVHVHT